MSVDLKAIKLRSWMGDSYESIKNLALHELSLPSAHNSGIDQKAKISDMWRACQYDSFRYQLDNGIRVLDIRLYIIQVPLGCTEKNTRTSTGLDQGAIYTIP